MPRKPFLCHFIDEVRANSFNDRNTDPRDILTSKLRAFDPDEAISDKLVLMLTRKLDREADFVGASLISKGIDYVRLNIEDIPDRLRIRYILDPDLSLEFTINGRRVDAARISVVWLRNFEPQVIRFPGNKLFRLFAFEQWNDAYGILQHNLKCNWVNHPDAVLKADDRVRQLSSAKALGFGVPETIITNDPKSVKDFYNLHKGEIVIKALHHHAVEIENKVYSMYTHKIVSRDLAKLKDLTGAPCILQKRIPKKADLRVTVVGKQVFAVEIDSQSTMKGREDLHRCPLEKLPKKAVKLRNTISKRCVQLINSFGLHYGAIDFVKDKNGHLVFLEINHTGDWLWIEQQTGLPITAAVANLISSLLKQ